ncbi:DUF3102 domain-containing protein [Bradyrhizobium sp. UFLA05-153]
MDLAAQQTTNDQPKTSQAYIDDIHAAWRKAVDGIVEAGRILLEAKERLRHGAFEVMVRTKLPFSESTARKLMAIARHPVLSDRSHGNVLPPSYGTLYALTKLPKDKLIEHIKDGTINPKLERKAAAALQRDQSPKTNKAPRRHLREENAQLRAELQCLHDDNDDIFDPNDTAANIARVIVEQMRRLSNNKANEVLQEVKKQIQAKELERRGSLN